MGVYIHDKNVRSAESISCTIQNGEDAFAPIILIKRQPNSLFDFLEISTSDTILMSLLVSH
jgi:hypothetical protein